MIYFQTLFPLSNSLSSINIKKIEILKSSGRESNPGLPCDRLERLPLDHDGLMDYRGAFYKFKTLMRAAGRRRRQRGAAGAVMYVLVSSMYLVCT